MLTTSQLRKAWGPACAPASHRVAIDLHGAGRITVDRRTQAAFVALNACLKAHGYATRRADTGAYNCRRITGGTGYSLHAYGIAVDINWQANPYSAANRTVTDMPAGMVAEIEALRTGNGRPVWGWGGNYRNIKDPMHYEIVCTPADLATGVVDAHAGPPPLTDDQKALVFIAAQKKAAKLPVLGQGHRRHPHRRAVARLQQLLGMTRTGVYGTATRAKVKGVQTFLGLPVTGIVDQDTWAWIIYAALVKGR
jgi:hypothetical protein